MSILHGFAGYYKVFGIRRVAAISTYRLIGVPKEISVEPDGSRYPVHLRVRTSDILPYGDPLLAEQYDFKLPRPPRTIVDVGTNRGPSLTDNPIPPAKLLS